MKRVLILGLACITGIVSSCTKEAEADKCEITKEKIVGTYLITKHEEKRGNGNYINKEIDLCYRDNTHTFNLDGTMEIKDLGVSCGSTFSPGTWSLPNTTTFVLYGDNYTIESFDCKTLVIFGSFIDDDGAGSARYTFTKQ